MWLLDESGNKVPTSGKDGAFGEDGVDGEDGLTPQLKIEEGMWFVSYDNGETWIELGQATGDRGPQGLPGVGGDPMFSNLDYSNPDYVIFYLGNGYEIKVPTWSAFEALKQQVEQMNQNISALQTIVDALQNNDYVKSVTPIYEDSKEVGYVIEFTKSGKVTIRHGQDGADGKDAVAPVIGVAKDEDGVYYWTVNGVWLHDESGNKVPATGKGGATDQGGVDGEDGTDGKDGITPQLMIQDGDWYVSYDNGMNWIYLGRATGDQGPQGDPGVGGDSMFTNLDYSNPDYVIFYLGNGHEIMIPTWSAFENLRIQCEYANQNIYALQEIVYALQEKDFINEVRPIYDEYMNQIGYELWFNRSGWISIYNGQNGSTPSIAVCMYDDGRYYWTINGQWLYDDYGNMIPTTGQDGASGANGVTPKLKIENGYWYVSYNEGVSWTKLSKATGADGEDGDAFFKSVTEDDKYVSLTLSDGTVIRIPKFEDPAVDISLSKVSGNAVIFNGTVNRRSLDLKVTVYYSTYSDISIYKYVGSSSVTEFKEDNFSLRVNGLVPKTQYYFFTEVICNGTKTFSEVNSFVTGETDSYIDWENGDNIEDEI